LFSATLNAYVKNLAYEYTKEPLEIEKEPEHITVNEVEQLLYHVPSANKMRLLLGILRRENPESAIIFCNTKRYTEVVARRLHENGVRCEFISGDLPQQKRLAIIENLKAGKLRYLVATDVAARGLDIEGLALVVNYDLPSETENYVHRIGRTARAGKTGKAVSFASEQDVYELTGIERYLGNKIPSLVASEEVYGEDAGGRQPRRDDRRRQRQETVQPGRKQSGRQPRREGRDAPVKGRETTSRDGARNSVDSAVLGLTFEERMAYYKGKYAGKGAEEGVVSGSGGGDKRRKRGKPDGARTATAPGAGEAKPRPGRREDALRRRGKPDTAGKPQKAAVNAGNEKVESPKKGLLSRVLGIFSGKNR
ncbi:MAG: DEAD/DEAH box helicase, partial [Spirochaetaceae bacterium]|nr:DEAD/DEAH box helicase [Spirochaetaceae bacterium]